METLVLPSGILTCFGKTLFCLFEIFLITLYGFISTYLTFTQGNEWV